MNGLSGSVDEGFRLVASCASFRYWRNEQQTDKGDVIEGSFAFSRAQLSLNPPPLLEDPDRFYRSGEKQ